MFYCVLIKNKFHDISSSSQNVNYERLHTNERASSRLMKNLKCGNLVIIMMWAAPNAVEPSFTCGIRYRFYFTWLVRSLTFCSHKNPDGFFVVFLCSPTFAFTSNSYLTKGIDFPLFSSYFSCIYANFPHFIFTYTTQFERFTYSDIYSEIDPRSEKKITKLISHFQRRE